VPIELIEFQPVFHQAGAVGVEGGTWSAKWERTESTKCAHVLRRLYEVGAACLPCQPSGISAGGGDEDRIARLASLLSRGERGDASPECKHCRACTQVGAACLQPPGSSAGGSSDEGTVAAAAAEALLGATAVAAARQQQQQHTAGGAVGSAPGANGGGLGGGGGAAPLRGILRNAAPARPLPASKALVFSQITNQLWLLVAHLEAYGIAHLVLHRGALRCVRARACVPRAFCVCMCLVCALRFGLSCVFGARLTHTCRTRASTRPQLRRPEARRADFRDQPL
jgi:hypothetical protein